MINTDSYYTLLSMDYKDIRWQQRFSNFEKAFNQLSQGIDDNPLPSDIIKEGIIQRFEFTHELAWKVLKDFLEYEGIQNITGSRSATKEAFNKGLIEDGQQWINMIESRNATVHTYDIDILQDEYNKIIHIYHPLFLQFHKKMKSFLQIWNGA